MKRLALCLVACMLWAQPVEAAFPAVSCTSTGILASTTHNATMPGTVNSGDLLLISAAIYGGNQGSSSVAASGWVELEELNDSNRIKLSTYYKFADGSEDGTSVDVATTNSVQAVLTVCRITGAHASQAPEKGTAATSAGVPSTTPNPPTVTASWGGEDNLFLASYAMQNGTAAASGFPTNYTNQDTDWSGNVSNPSSGGVASRELANATDDPGTFTTVNEDWIAQTVVIRPAAAAGGCTGGLLLLGAGKCD
jgi:hypothetical protein